jgi:hypothetical protein
MSEFETSNMSIVDYVNFLYKKNGIDFMVDSLQSQFFDVSTFVFYRGTEREKHLIKIKYFEHCRVWTKWGRHCRGVILRLNYSTDLYVCDKMMLIRGAEVLTNVHMKANITETQDISFKESSYLDASQCDTIERLMTPDSLLDGYLSFKSDGSLFAISLYPWESFAGIFYYQLIQDHGDTFAQGILQLAIDLQLPFFPIFSTQGTLFLSNDMQDYMVTSLLIGTCEQTEESLQTLAFEGLTPLDALKLVGKGFFNQLWKFFEYSTRSTIPSPMTLSFEAICKNRHAVWPNSKKHIELAVNYPFTTLRFLGCTIGLGETIGNYRAHFQWPDLDDYFSSIGTGITWDQPMYWQITTAKDVESMMHDLSRVIRGDLTDREYLQLHPPVNLSTVRFPYLDYEGWILYRELPDGTLDYSKIKTNEYYVSHKFRLQNIPILLAIAEAGKSDIFPLAKVIQTFYVNLPEKLMNIIQEIQTIVHNEDHPDFQLLWLGMSSKQQQSYVKQSLETKIRMLINCPLEAWAYVCSSIFSRYFPSLPVSSSSSAAASITSSSEIASTVIATATGVAEEDEEKGVVTTEIDSTQATSAIIDPRPISSASRTELNSDLFEEVISTEKLIVMQAQPWLSEEQIREKIQQMIQEAGKNGVGRLFNVLLQLDG